MRQVGEGFRCGGVKEGPVRVERGGRGGGHEARWSGSKRRGGKG